MTQHYLTPLLAAIAVTFALATHAAPVVSTASPPTSEQVEQAPIKLNINSADATVLQRELSGVGKAKAEAIVTYRESHGDFASVEELLEVEGIGKTLLDRNRDKITVN